MKKETKIKTKTYEVFYRVIKEDTELVEAIDATEAMRKFEEGYKDCHSSLDGDLEVMYAEKH